MFIINLIIYVNNLCNRVPPPLYEIQVGNILEVTARSVSLILALRALLARRALCARRARRIDVPHESDGERGAPELQVKRLVAPGVEGNACGVFVRLKLVS